jgi:CPA2 family monovalent cation:H+ antiporter-2
MGWLVIQDIIAVLVLVLLPQMVGQKEFDPANFALLFLMTLVKVAILVAGVFLLGSWFIPTVLFNIAKTRSRELFTLTVLVLALGIAVVSAQIFGVSMALGAFLAGMVVGRSEFSIRAANEALPMRDAFAVLFFVSIGMMLDPVAIWFKPFLPLCALGVVMIGTPLVSMVLLLLLGRRPRPAAILALSLGQIGEFSFIIVLMGREMEVLSQDAVQAVVAASLFSISLNPLIKRFAKPLEKLLVGLGWERKTALSNDGTATEISDPLPRAIIIGFGPVGRILCRLLEENKIVPTIIELNMETVMRLRAQGIFAIYGDASHPDTLKSAGVADADALILSTSSLPGAKEVIRIARERNPKIGVLARASYLREQKDLLDCGADQAFSGEGEVALAMTEAVLARLGATPEQIDRERERVREELFGTPKTEMSVGGQV